MIQLTKGISLVLMAIAFGASHVMAQDDGFIWDDTKTCQVYVASDVKTRTASYYGGTCKNYRLEGTARLIIHNNGKYYSTSSGNFINGYLEGQGEIIWSSGERFNGIFVKGRRSSGKYSYSDGSSYTGSFNSAGELDGKGSMDYGNGKKFVGMFKNDARNGMGIEYLANGDWFECNYYGGGSDGTGKYHFKNIGYYEGYFKNDVSEKGIMHYNNGKNTNGSMKDYGKFVEEGAKTYFSKNTIAEYRRTHTIKNKNISVEKLSNCAGFILYNPDEPEKIYSFLSLLGISSEKRAFTNRDNKGELVVGSDWGIQMIDEYKGYSLTYFVGDVISPSTTYGFFVNPSMFQFSPRKISFPGNSFESSTDAALHLLENFGATARKRTGDYLIDPILLDFSDDQQLLFMHFKGKGRRSKLLSGNDANEDMDDDLEADAEEEGIVWGSIKNISRQTHSNGDHWLNITCKIADEDGAETEQDLLLWVTAGKEDKVREALVYLNKYPLTNIREIAKLKKIYEEIIAKVKTDNENKDKDEWRKTLGSKFSSVSDAVNYLNNNFDWANTAEEKYYVELSFSSTSASFTFKNYDASTNKVTGYVTKKTLYWPDLTFVFEYMPNAGSWASESDCFKIEGKAGKSINVDGTNVLRLYWKTSYRDKWQRIEDAFYYLREFAK